MKIRSYGGAQTSRSLKESVGIISHGFVYMTAMMEVNETCPLQQPSGGNEFIEVSYCITSYNS